MGKKKKAEKQEKWFYCENESGGLGIEPCQGVSELATVEFTVDMAFSGFDRPTIHLCEDCATRLKEHAEDMGYEPKIS